jgi:RNA polymerase sigma-70 factor (ECF subfamily)
VDAFTHVCQAYWYPVFAFLRRRGESPADAEDHTQAFFTWLLESNVIARADPERGRFRTFLVTALRQFVVRRHLHDSAQKRTPAGGLTSIDARDGEKRYRMEPADLSSPDRQFDRAWALSVLDRVMTRLRDEWTATGRVDRFDVLKSCLTGDAELAGRDLAQSAGMSEGAFRVAVHRLKRRYGELLRLEVGATVDSETEVDDELRDLMRALADG